jgi:hypothetical protein
MLSTTKMAVETWGVTTCNVNSASFSHAFWQTQDLQYLLIGYTMRPWPAPGVVPY